MEPEIDRVLVATVQFNVEVPGKCDACGQQTREHRALKVGYRHEPPNAAERERRMRAGQTEQEIVDSYFQQLAARQLNSEFGQETRDVLCASCAAQLIDQHMAGSGSQRVPPEEGAALLRRARSRREPIFVGLCLDVERGAQGRIQPTCAVRVDAAVDPATILRAAPPMRSGDAPRKVRLEPDASSASGPQKHAGPASGVAEATAGKKPRKQQPQQPLSRRQRHQQHQRRQPAVNLGQLGQVTQAYEHLFPADWRELSQRLRDFDTAWFAAHPGAKGFVREYVPGEAYPKHDPTARYVEVIRSGNMRTRLMVVKRAAHLPFVELPDDLKPGPETEDDSESNE